VNDQWMAPVLLAVSFVCIVTAVVCTAFSRYDMGTYFLLLSWILRSLWREAQP
jgi:hypothetical protein